jgi:hypothetical protein
VVGLAKGVAGHPNWLWGWPATPKRPKHKTKKKLRVWGLVGPPLTVDLGVGAFGSDPATLQNPNLFFLFLIFWPFGGGRTTPKGLGWFRPPHTADLGVAQGLWGWSGHPPKPLTFLFCFVFWPFGGGRTTPKTDWGGSSTPIMGVTGHPLCFFLF